MKTPEIILKFLRDYFKWTAAVVVLIVLSIGYGLVLAKKVSVIQTISFSDRTRAKNDLALAEANLSSLRASLEKFQTAYTAADRARLDQLLPTTSEFPDILLTIQNMANIAGLDLQTVNVTKINNAPASTEPTSPAPQSNVPDTSGGLGAIISAPGLSAEDIAITVGKGTSYDQFKRFLSIIESSGRVFDIMSLTYVRPAADDAGSVYSFTLRTYVMTKPAVTPTN